MPRPKARRICGHGIEPAGVTRMTTEQTRTTHAQRGPERETVKRGQRVGGTAGIKSTAHAETEKNRGQHDLITADATAHKIHGRLLTDCESLVN